MLHFVGHFDVQPCAGFNSRTPAPPCAGHRRLSAVSSSLSSSLFLSPSLLSAPGRRLLLSSSRRVARRPVRAGPGLGPAGADARRSPHGALARPARGERDRGDVINPAASRSARQAQEPSCGERFAFRCLRGYLRLRSYAALSPARGRRPAMWVRSHVARGGSVCGASYLSYSQPADYACARLPYLFAYDFGISLLISRYTYQHVIKSFRISQSMRGYPVKISQYVLKTFRTVRTLNPTPSAPKQWKSEVHVKS